MAPLEVSPITPASPIAALSRGALAAALRPRESRARLTDLLGELNPPQRAAATRPDGPLLVVAGPGAGKTRVIVARIAHLVLERGVPPDEITAITFSRRAAGELQARLATLGGVTAPAPVEGPLAESPPGAGVGAIWAGTFHALGARLLRRGGALRFGRPREFTIYDADDAERTLRRVLGAMGVPTNRLARLTTAARHAVSLAKRQATLAGPDPVPATAGAHGDRSAGAPNGDGREGAALEGAVVGEGAEAVPLAEVLRRYDAALLEAAAFDFDDLVGCAAGALDAGGALRAGARAGARHLLVDEYQDTDAAQEALLRRLSPPPLHGDLCVVADPQQSIYAFRGAAPEQVRRFLTLWPGAGVARLEQNYRSTKSIVAVARRLAVPRAGDDDGARGERFALRLWTANEPGPPARLWVAPHPEAEATAIARDVAASLQAGADPEGVAILVRTHAQARPVEGALLRAGVPYALIGGVRFFAREEIKDALAYLRLAILREDAAAFWRVVNTPRRGLGPAALLTVARYALAGESAGAPGSAGLGDSLGHPLDQAPGAAGSPRDPLEDAADPHADLFADSLALPSRRRRERIPEAMRGLLLRGGMREPPRGPVAGARRWAATDGAPDGLYDLLAHVDELTGLWYGGAGPASLLETALQRTAYRDFLRRAYPDSAQSRLDALAELIRLAAPYDDVRRFLDDAALSGEADDPAASAPRTRGRVRLSTVHAAKGLEFRAVYVPGCEAGLFPLGSAGQPPLPGGADPDAHNPGTAAHDPGVHEPPPPDPEERRVFYVAVTRARERLTLSYCTFRRDERTRPSPFLAEIGRGLLRRAKLGTDDPPARKRPSTANV